MKHVTVAGVCPDSRLNGLQWKVIKSSGQKQSKSSYKPDSLFYAIYVIRPSAIQNKSVNLIGSPDIASRHPDLEELNLDALTNDVDEEQSKHDVDNTDDLTEALVPDTKGTLGQGGSQREENYLLEEGGRDCGH